MARTMGGAGSLGILQGGQDATNNFTSKEWAWIRRQSEKVGGGVESARDASHEREAEPFAMLRRFFHMWTLKESFIKAVGVGLMMDLRRVEFAVKDIEGVAGMDSTHFAPAAECFRVCGTASLHIDGHLDDGWECSVFEECCKCPPSTSGNGDSSFAALHVAAVVCGCHCSRAASSIKTDFLLSRPALCAHQRPNCCPQEQQIASLHFSSRSGFVEIPPEALFGDAQ